MELKELLLSLPALMSVSGYERYSTEKLNTLIGDVFDEAYTDAIGNHVFIKRCGKEKAPKILVDCHFDEIGMIVSGISEDGFLSVAGVGGVDTRLLGASEVVIYGKEEISGVFAATPPHLIGDGEGDKLKSLKELVIDTGYTGKELEDICNIGTPVGYKPRYTELLGGRIAGKGFDDKACGACAVYGIQTADKNSLAGDVYFVFSTREEIGGVGAQTATYGIDPDYALVMDVTYAYTPEMNRGKHIYLGSGAAVCMSAVTDRRLTKKVISLCEQKGIKYSIEAEPNNTGTNANKMSKVGDGVPTVLASLPLKNMHTANEMLALEDCETLSLLVREFICSKEIAEVFAR